MARREEFDVCVIGTGGGGVLIDQLTAAGLRVVALQRGPHLRPKDFVQVVGYPGSRHDLGGYTSAQMIGKERIRAIWGEEI